MKIHNYGNDYVQANKFKESVDNVCNQTATDRPEPTEAVSEAEATEETAEAAAEGKENRRSRKGKKQSD